MDENNGMDNQRKVKQTEMIKYSFDLVCIAENIYNMMVMDNTPIFAGKKKRRKNHDANFR